MPEPRASSSMKLKEKVALITGASKGIGRAIASAFAAEGCRVAMMARSAAALDEAARHMGGGGTDVMALPGDVSKEGDVYRVVQETVGRFGRLDMLVNNAGVGFFKKVEEMTVEEFDTMWAVNMRGVFLCTRAALPHMFKQGEGEIVNIASLAGKNSLAGGAGYAATKWALRAFASSLMLEVRDRGVRVITIFPGSVDTTFSSRGPRGTNITQPQDVAEAVVFAVTAPRRAMFSEIDVRPSIPR